MSAIAHGYLADMGLPARFIHAAARGRPFFVNKYDWRRWRLSIAEGAAHGNAALAVHWDKDDDEGFDPRHYTEPVIQYQRFVADREVLYHPARPYSQIAVVYPRRSEVAGEGDSTDALRRVGRVLENEHLLFDLILDEQLLERGGQYQALVVADVPRLSAEEGQFVRTFAERGGQVILTGNTGCLDAQGRAHSAPLFAPWQRGSRAGQIGPVSPCGRGRVMCLGDWPWAPENVQVREGKEILTYPPAGDDDFGLALAPALDALLGERTLSTDAPWYVRVRAWRPERTDALVVHWVNYHQEEDADEETPVPAGPFRAELSVPGGWKAATAEWHTPEQGGVALELSALRGGRRIELTVPAVTVYGLVVLRLSRRPE